MAHRRRFRLTLKRSPHCRAHEYIIVCKGNIRCGEISCSHFAAGNTDWKQGLPYSYTMSAKHGIHPLPPLNMYSPPVFKIPWHYFLDLVRAPSPINAIRARIAHQIIQCWQIYTPFYFFALFETNSSGKFNQCAALRLISLICDLRVYLNKITLWRQASKALAGVIWLSAACSPCWEGYCEFIFIWFYAAHRLCLECALSVALHLWGMRNNWLRALLLVCLRRQLSALLILQTAIDF